MPRPATQNQKDCALARNKLSAAIQLIDEAWRLVQAIERREKQQHGSTGRTDTSQAKRRKTIAKRKVSRRG